MRCSTRTHGRVSALAARARRGRPRLAHLRQGRASRPTPSRRTCWRSSVALVGPLAAERPEGPGDPLGKARASSPAPTSRSSRASRRRGGARVRPPRLGDASRSCAPCPSPPSRWCNGFCMGGGVELALACRYRVALDVPGDALRAARGDARHHARLGRRASGCRSWSARRAALDMMLTGRSVDATRAKRMGLVDEAVPLRVMENAARIVTSRGAGAARSCRSCSG